MSLASRNVHLRCLETSKGIEGEQSQARMHRLGIRLIPLRPKTEMCGEPQDTMASKSETVTSRGPGHDELAVMSCHRYVVMNFSVILLRRFASVKP